MTSRAGNKRSRSKAMRPAPPRQTAALTLIELILVMALLSFVFALVAPSLGRFFRGRSLDSEAKRLLALTRYGQSRAVSEGVPMMLWLDEENKTYGLQAAMGYREQVDTNAVEFALAERLEIEVATPSLSASSVSWDWNRTMQPTVDTMGLVETAHGQASLPAIQFLPSGFVGESSPPSIELRQGVDGQDGRLWIGQSRNRLNYEIQTNKPPDFQR